MGLIDVKCLIFITGFLLSGSLSKEHNDSSNNAATSARTMTSLTIPTSSFINEEKALLNAKPRLDFVTPATTVPVFDPSNPAATTTPTYIPIPTPNPATPIMTPSTPAMMPGNPYTAPGMGTPLSSSQSWCIASQAASQTALQVALDYACGYGGADCSEIQPGSSCYNPDTVRDHASYAFNSYYQKNPVSTSCDFGGTAVITNVDPSASACQYPSSSAAAGAGSSIPNTTPTGPTIYGSVPPDSTSRALALRTASLFITSACFLISMDR